MKTTKTPAQELRDLVARLGYVNRGKGRKAPGAITLNALGSLIGVSAGSMTRYLSQAAADDGKPWDVAPGFPRSPRPSVLRLARLLVAIQNGPVEFDRARQICGATPRG